MNWLWPRQLQPTTTTAVRLGRFLHWSSLGLAPSFLLCAFFMQSGSALLMAFAAYPIGRGLRYILADE